MKGYVWFNDGHREDILHGVEFDDPCYPKDKRYIMVETQSGCYRKTINKRTGNADCYGFQAFPGYTHPVNVLGYNGVVDIVVDDFDVYQFNVSSDGVNGTCGRVKVKKGASANDVRLAVLNTFKIVDIEKVSEERG